MGEELTLKCKGYNVKVGGVESEGRREWVKGEGKWRRDKGDG